MIKVRQFDSSTTLISALLDLLRKVLPTSGNLMLSGGSTPYSAYDLLAEAPCSIHSERTLFLSDERMVAEDSPKNNAHNLAPMLTALGCHDRFIRVDTRLTPEAASTVFETALQPMQTIDYGLLGMGADGHTAGFFTMEQAQLKNGSLTLYTDRPDGMQGVSVSPALFKHIEQIILLVSGEAKRDIVNTLLNHPETIPAGVALIDHPNVELWTDIGPA